MYSYTDKIIQTLNRRYIALFNRLKNLSDDDDEIILEVNRIYEEIDRLTKQAYLLLAKKIYQITMDMVEGDWEDIEAIWLLGILDDYNPVTKYVYSHEVDRKRARLIEALISSDNKAQEVERAKKLWARQSKQYAEYITDMATEKAYRDGGIEEVVWITERDERVCGICEGRDGVRYFIDEIPDKPHYGCRCRVRPLEAKDLLWNGYFQRKSKNT